MTKRGIKKESEHYVFNLLNALQMKAYRKEWKHADKLAACVCAATPVICKILSFSPRAYFSIKG